MESATRWRQARRRLGAAAMLFCVLGWVGVGVRVTVADAKQRGITPPVARQVLTLDEAARLLRVPAGELHRLAHRHEIPARRIAQQWRFNRQALLAWLNGDWTLITTVVAPDGPPDVTPLASPAMGRIAGAGTDIAQNQTEPSNREAAAGGKAQEPIGEAPEERTAEDIFLRGQKVLLAPGEVTLDAGLFYSESDRQQLALVDTTLGLATVQQRTFTTLLQGRIGVVDETELFAGITFFDQDSDVLFGSSKIADSGRTEFGDVRLGIRRTLLREGPGRPDIIATLSGRVPTGETSFALGGGLAFVKSVDPVVLFANANYRHTFSRDFDDVTRLEARDRLDVTLGYAYALNDTLTLSTSLSGVFLGETDFDNATLRQRELFSLRFGLTSWLAKGLYIEPTVSFGLNGPGDNFALGVTVPYTF